MSQAPGSNKKLGMFLFLSFFGNWFDNFDLGPDLWLAARNGELDKGLIDKFGSQSRI